MWGEGVKARKQLGGRKTEPARSKNRSRNKEEKNRGKVGTQRERTKRNPKRDRKGKAETDGDETQKESEIIWGYGEVSLG